MFIYIKQPGCNFRYNGKNYRTPIKLKISASEKNKILNLLKFKAITNYEIIDDLNHKNDNKFQTNVTNKMKRFLNIDDIRTNDDNLINHNETRKVLTSRVVDNIKIDNNKNNIDTNYNTYHDTIENPVDIDIDMSSDDILQQLLDKI